MQGSFNEAGGLLFFQMLPGRFERWAHRAIVGLPPDREILTGECRHDSVRRIVAEIRILNWRAVIKEQSISDALASGKPWTPLQQY